MDTEQQNPENKERRVPDMDSSSESSAVERKAEARLIRKMDLYILPIVVLLYLFSFLDRGVLAVRYTSTITLTCGLTVNIGNARLYGLEEDLGLTGNQYQVAVSILFVTYCVCTGPASDENID